MSLSKKIQIYFMPGMAASSKIFELLHLPQDKFETHFLEWKLPKKDEPINLYAKRMSEEIRHKNAILVGVSFGGVLVQEMAKFVNPKKVVIISSVKSCAELPKRMQWAKNMALYKIFPSRLLKEIPNLKVLAITKSLKKKFQLYDVYFYRKESVYLDWAVKNMLCWNVVDSNPNIIHIHGTADNVFPIKNIKNCIAVKGGTHAMILTKAKWFNENLPNLLDN